MTQEQKARESWKTLYKAQKGSPEELTAYQQYVSISQGNKPAKKIKTIREIKQPVRI
jgi:hypothetical protein